MRSVIHLSTQPLMWVLAVCLVMVLTASSLTGSAYAQTATPGSTTDETAQDIVEFTETTTEVVTETASDFIDRLTQTPKSDVVRALLVIGGLILLLAGWQVYDFIVLIAGFLIGALAALALVGDENTLLAVGAFLLGGVLGAALATLLFHVSVFLIGAYMGIVLTRAAALMLGLTPVSALALVIAAIAGGMLLIGLSFEFLVLLSSLVGAQMLSLGLGLGLQWTIIFAIIGIVVQLGATRFFGYPARRPVRRRLLRRV